MNSSSAKTSFMLWLKDKTAGMSAKESMQFLESKEYYQKLFFASTALNMKALDKLIAFDRIDALDRYWFLMSQNGDNEALVEAMMIDEWMIPPTFKQLVYCTACEAHVLVKKKDFDTVTSCCWCSSGLYQKEIV